MAETDLYDAYRQQVAIRSLGLQWWQLQLLYSCTTLYGSLSWWADRLTVLHYRQDAARRQTAGIKFTHRPKIRFFAPQGRLVAPIQVKLGTTDGHLGPLGCAKFDVNRCSGLGMRPPKYQKFPLFGKESLPWPTSKIFRGFYTSNYPTLVFQISCDSHHRLRSYCGETARR